MLPVPDPDQRIADLRRVFPANPLAVRENLGQMQGLHPLTALTPDHLATVELVLAEVLNNVAEHAYAGGDGDVEVVLSLGPDGLLCRVSDTGAPMPEGALPAGDLPDLSDAGFDDLPEGGFGWHLIRTLTQGLAYARSRGCNRLTFMVPQE
jgi:serine/threonine-protein kinase RsbW